MVERTRPGLGIPDLDDEVRDDAVEPLAVVEPTARELDEVVDVPGRVRGEQLDADLATILERHHRLRRFRRDRGRRPRGRRRLRERRRGPREDRGSGEREEAMDHAGSPRDTSVAAMNNLYRTRTTQTRGRAGATRPGRERRRAPRARSRPSRRSEEHTSELQSLAYLVCRLLLEKKKNDGILREK